MTFLDTLVASTASYTAAWLAFTLAHSPGADEWYLFLEGELDVAYYRGAFRQVVSNSTTLHTFKCGGRDGVVEARVQVRRSHPSCNRCLFFVDKDLRDYLGLDLSKDDQTYCTEFYSIENYIVDENALEVVWTEFWGLALVDPRWNHVKSQFVASQMRFYRALTPVMAWIILAKSTGSRPNVNNINLSKFVSFDEELLPSRLPRSASEIKKQCSCEPRIEIGSLIRTTKRLLGDRPKLFVRGKFDLWFFVAFLSRLDRAMTHASGRSPKKAIPTTRDSLAAALTGKTPISDDLSAFLLSAAERAQKHVCVA